MGLYGNDEDLGDFLEKLKINETVWKRGEGECSYVHVKGMLSTQKSVLLLAGYNTSFN
jgi:hypothetical protein